jgi:hypothetical protein
MIEGLSPDVAALLKSYDVEWLSWDERAHRYAVAREVLDRGGEVARAWLEARLTKIELRALVAEFHGAGMNEPLRARVRAELGLTEVELPRRPYLGFG